MLPCGVLHEVSVITDALGGGTCEGATLLVWRYCGRCLEVVRSAHCVLGCAPVGRSFPVERIRGVPCTADKERVHSGNVMYACSFHLFSFVFLCGC